MKAIERYGKQIENRAAMVGLTIRPELAEMMARAVIEEFVEDVAKEMCIDCTEGWPFEDETMEWHFNGDACRAHHVREAARRLLEESDVK